MYILAENGTKTHYVVKVYDHEPNASSVPIDVRDDDDLISIVYDLEEKYGMKVHSAFVLTGEGEWLQPDCLTLAECLECSLEPV
jgi:hypothetical protein